MTFLKKLAHAQQKNRSYLCIGLDVVVAHTPLPLQGHDEPMLPFARAIIEATQDLVCAYKPNLGFFLAEGAAGMVALERIVRIIPADIPIILDGKFGDIGNTAVAYARGAFEQFRADAVTLSPYIGSDSVKPFLASAEHGAFVLARTSNPNAAEFQSLHLGVEPSLIHRQEASTTELTTATRQNEWNTDDRLLYEHVALAASQWNHEVPGTCGLVVGATAPRELERIRALTPDLPFLIPGVGAQGGDLQAALKYGFTRGGLGPVVNASRSVIYASQTDAFAYDARTAALQIVQQMRNQVVSDGL